jgi:hypothetical protein
VLVQFSRFNPATHRLRPLKGETFVRDPETDFKFAFEDVEFPAMDGRTLRGWLVPASVAYTDFRSGLIFVYS